MNLKQTQQSHSHGEQGFTLMETAISLVIMLVVGLGAASLFFYSATRNTSARDRQLSMVVAQQQMEKLRAVSFDNLSTAVTNAGGSPKTVTSAGRSYRVTTTIVDTTATLKTITVKVSSPGAATWTTQNFGGVSLVTQRAKS
jgi:Tfp pilus assembly protein PilV